MSLLSHKVKSDINILVVDDDEDIVNYLEMLLKKKEYSVDSCTNSEMALEKIMTYKYQLIISDIQMPGMLGTDLLRRIREKEIFARVIMITAYSTLKIVLECMYGGADDFIFKPLEKKEVFKSVDSCVQKIRRWREITKEAAVSTEKFSD